MKDKFQPRVTRTAHSGRLDETVGVYRRLHDQHRQMAAIVR
jgi:hypothetical protein